MIRTINFHVTRNLTELARRLATDFNKYKRHTLCRSYFRTVLTSNRSGPLDINKPCPYHLNTTLLKDSDLSDQGIEVTFVKPNGKNIHVRGNEGDSLLDIIVNNSVDLDGFGACEGTLECSTCHLIFSREDFDRLPNKPSEEELDMLDTAPDLQETSRLGCQIVVSKELSGLKVQVPAGIYDART